MDGGRCFRRRLGLKLISRKNCPHYSLILRGNGTAKAAGGALVNVGSPCAQWDRHCAVPAASSGWEARQAVSYQPWPPRPRMAPPRQRRDMNLSSPVTRFLKRDKLDKYIPAPEQRETEALGQPQPQPGGTCRPWAVFPGAARVPGRGNGPEQPSCPRPGSQGGTQVYMPGTLPTGQEAAPDANAEGKPMWSAQPVTPTRPGPRLRPRPRPEPATTSFF